MTGPEGNSEFCFLRETVSFVSHPQCFPGEAEGNIEVKGKQNLLLPARPVIKCFIIPSNSKIEKKTAKNMFA